MTALDLLALGASSGALVTSAGLFLRAWRRDRVERRARRAWKAHVAQHYAPKIVQK